MLTFRFTNLASWFALAAFMGTNCFCAEVLSDNVSRTVADVEIVEGQTWLTSSFGTGTSPYLLSGAALLLDNSDNVQISLSLYSDASFAPGSLVGQLTAPATFGTGLLETAFAGNSLALSANTTYWLVLQAISSGELGWAWTDDNFGSGIGFQHTFGATDDGGQSWYTTDIQPMMMSVTADPSSAPAAPEPSAVTLLLMGGAFIATVIFTKRVARRKEA